MVINDEHVVEKDVHLWLKQRTGRKYMTEVQGLASDLDLKKIMKCWNNVKIGDMLFQNVRNLEFYNKLLFTQNPIFNIFLSSPKNLVIDLTDYN